MQDGSILLATKTFCSKIFIDENDQKTEHLRIPREQNCFNLELRNIFDKKKSLLVVVI